MKRENGMMEVEKRWRKADGMVKLDMWFGGKEGRRKGEVESNVR